jgi:hypothetical protein
MPVFTAASLTRTAVPLRGAATINNQTGHIDIVVAQQ